MIYPIVVIVIAAYLLGNLNGAVCISTLCSKEDVRSHGSGNAGLTNFIRNYGVKSALLVVAIDMGKTAIACLVGGLILKPLGYEQEGMILGALAVSLGHDFPALLGFRGGKGILCGLTIALVVDWRIAVMILITFFALYFITGYVSLGSVVSCVAFCAGFGIFHHDNLYVMIGGIVIGLMALFMHRTNIGRLLKGTESKTNLFAKGKKS